MVYKDFYEARDIIEEFIRKDIVGPVNEDEIIGVKEENPQKYYSAGILYPQDKVFDQEENEQMETEDLNEAINLSNSFNPSSIAVSTTIKPQIKKVKVKCEFARYESFEKEDSNSNEYAWKRKSFDFEKNINIKDPEPIELENNLYLDWILQKEYDDGAKTVSFALINKNQSKDSITDNENSFFQPSLEVMALNENDEIFIPRRMKIGLSKDKEIKRFEMLYRHVKHYAIGHGCSVDWKEGDNNAYKIETSIIPENQVQQMKPAYHIDSEHFNIKRLSTENKGELKQRIEKFMSSYEDWLNDKWEEFEDMDDKFKDVARENLHFCGESKKRIMNAIDLFDDDDVLRAFRLANRAMYLQRVQHLKKTGEEVNEEKINWYPFQLAFILQVIPSIVNEDSEYREVVDLLWFPTGGGKTEAYLGLAAFTIFYRRLTTENPAGVTVLMRYTLRLLTVQQFERASALISACELLRRENLPDQEEISIGLWVGGNVTPNWIENAEENLNKIKNHDRIMEEGNPCQLLICPWCGEKLNSHNYDFSNEKHSIECGNESCEFGDGLPIYLIDEEIYENKPTFIVSTIDKYARMTWESRISKLFSLDSKTPPSGINNSG